MATPNKNKMSGGGRPARNRCAVALRAWDRASLGVEGWESSQKLIADRSPRSRSDGQMVGADTGKSLLLKSIVPPDTEPRPEAIPKLGGQNRADEGTHHRKTPPPTRGVTEEPRRQVKAD
jgi:hypothetical protein